MRNGRQRLVSGLALVITVSIPMVGDAADGSTHPLLAMLLWIGGPLFLICAGLGVAFAAQALFLFRSTRERKKQARALADLRAKRRRAALRIVHSRHAVMQTRGRHGVPGQAAELGHLDLDVAMEQVRELRGDDFRWMAVQVTACPRYVRSLIRRALPWSTGDRADPAR